MKYLVTGGAGFIGSNIVKELLKQGQEVRVLDNFATGKRENILPLLKDPKLTLIEGDLRSFHIVRSAVKGVDYILHQGALPSVPRSINDPITTNDVNILGMLNILEAAKEFEVKRVICASSSSIYGNSESLPKVETMPVNPMSPYALTKYTQERYCQIFYQLYGLETVSLRYFNVFGPNQDPTSQYSAVIPKFIKLMMQNKSPVIYGDGNQSRDFTYVADPKYRDRWKVHKELDAFHGDCDDFAVTFAYRAMGRRFWVPLFKGELELYYVDYKGNGHMICCINDTW